MKLFPMLEEQDYIKGFMDEYGDELNKLKTHERIGSDMIACILECVKENKDIFYLMGCLERARQNLEDDDVDTITIIGYMIVDVAARAVFMFDGTEYDCKNLPINDYTESELRDALRDITNDIQ